MRHTTVAAAAVVAAVVAGLTGVPASAGTSLPGPPSPAAATAKGKAKGKDIVIITNRGSARFKHRGNLLVVCDTANDGYQVTGEYRVGRRAGKLTDGNGPRPPCAKRKITNREGEVVRLRLCLAKIRNKTCSPWRSGRS